jgi:hypothetical protein
LQSLTKNFLPWEDETMLRKLLVAGIVLGFAASASAVPIVIAPGTGTVTMHLTIGTYAAVQVPPGLDEEIWFSPDVAGGTAPDFYRTTADGVRGVYTPLIAPPDPDPWPSTREKATTDAWATGYYESADGADYWLSANTPVTMTIVSGGGLTDGSTVLPTWFTLAAAGPFNYGGTTLNDGTIPFDGPGSYFADESPADGTMEVGGTAFFPTQYPFDMLGTPSWTHVFPSPSQGSLKFLGRVLRNNTSDPAGVYTTTLAVTFTAP